MRPSPIAFALITLTIFTTAGIAQELGQTPPPISKTPPGPGTGGDGREGGETVDDAFPIPALPFTDTGNTCDNLHDYEEMCPYGGSLAPDVVYAYAPPANTVITIDLCASSYDTKVFVYEDVVTPGAPYACNDDDNCGYSGYQSRIRNLPIDSGHTYFIVVDGYSSACGDYDLSIIYYEPCVVECPPGAMPEGEPPLVENYVDEYNGGCSAHPPVFQQLPGDAGGHLDFCGRSGTYLYYSLDFRDTDWFTCIAAGTSITASITPEFETYIMQLSTDCATVEVLESALAERCETGTISFATVPGEEVWLFASTAFFSGVPEYTYLLVVDGIEPGATAVELSTWGAVKALYQ
jgi:hypothetical protein